MAYTMEKYGALARKHGYEPVDAAIAAFDVMRTRAVRVADDPWAVVTRAVAAHADLRTRAEGLLCSTHQARREASTPSATTPSGSATARRRPATSTRRSVDARLDAIDEDEPTQRRRTSRPTPSSRVDDAVEVFVALRWPRTSRGPAIEYICTRLMRSGNRADRLRGTASRPARPSTARRRPARLAGRSCASCSATSTPTAPHGRRSRVLLRLLIGDDAEDLLADRTLVAEIATSASPRGLVRRRSPCLSTTDTSSWSAASTRSSSASATARTPATHRTADEVDREARPAAARDDHARRRPGLRRAAASKP